MTEEKIQHSIIVTGGGENAPTMVSIDGRMYRCTIKEIHESLVAGKGSAVMLDLVMTGFQVPS